MISIQKAIIVILSVFTLLHFGALRNYAKPIDITEYKEIAYQAMIKEAEEGPMMAVPRLTYTNTNGAMMSGMIFSIFERWKVKTEIFIAFSITRQTGLTCGLGLFYRHAMQ